MLYDLVLPPWWPIALIVVLMAAMITGRNILARKRTETLRDVAARLGLRFEGVGWNVSAHAPQLETPLFEGRHGEQIRNVMSGSRAGIDSSFFDYSFKQGKSSSHQTVSTFSQGGWLPQFAIGPQDILHKLSDAILHKEIHFQSNPGFSKRLRLLSVDEDKVRELFTPGLLSFFEHLDTGKGWRIEGFGRTLVIYCLGKTAKPHEFPSFVEETTRISEAFLNLAGLKKPTN